MDMTTISTVLGSLKTATDIARYIKDTDLSLEKAETKLKLADLISALADAKLEAVNIQEALSDAQRQIKALEHELEIQGSVRYEAPLYWLEGKSSVDGPYCQHCYDTGKKLIRLQGNNEGWYMCTACKNDYETKGAAARPPFIGLLG